MDLYVFGAGASAAEGAPATAEFFARAWELLGPAFDDRVRLVWRFLRATFGRPLHHPIDFSYLPAVDEVISLVDWSLHMNQGLGPAYDTPELYEVRRALEHLLCQTLAAALRREQAGGAHARFARALALRQAGRPFALITLNYDTLLDEALREEGLVPDYGLLGGDRPGGPLLAKLHGSLNWARCPACGRVTVLGPGAHRGAPLASPPVGCPQCGCPRLRRLIISPTWLKSYDGSQLQPVWDRALEAVQRAERIVFVGYSMPPADVAVHHLIRRGLLARQASPPQVEVVNHAPQGAPEHAQAVRDRFLHLFGADVRFDFSGFHGQT
jgi:NAD-dependent SIR2 family protein deacetylase